MGYRSDILIAVAFKTKTQRDEVWAVYCADPDVQKHNLAGKWKHTDDGEFTPIVYHYDESVKWYDGYEDVQGFERLLSLVEEFEDNRGFDFAYIKYRTGEELNDVEAVEAHSVADGSLLMDALWERANIERRITHDF